MTDRQTGRQPAPLPPTDPRPHTLGGMLEIVVWFGACLRNAVAPLHVFGSYEENPSEGPLKAT